MGNTSPPLIWYSKFSKGCYYGAGVLALYGDAKKVGLVQPGEETTSKGPYNRLQNL